MAGKLYDSNGKFIENIDQRATEFGKDYMESSSVENDTLKYIFVGRVGQFCPIVKGADGAYHADIRHWATEFGKDLYGKLF